MAFKNLTVQKKNNYRCLKQVLRACDANIQTANNWYADGHDFIDISFINTSKTDYMYLQNFSMLTMMCDSNRHITYLVV